MTITFAILMTFFAIGFAVLNRAYNKLHAENQVNLMNSRIYAEQRDKEGWAHEETKKECQRLSKSLLHQQKENHDLFNQIDESKRLAQFRDIFPTGEIEPPAWGVEEDAQCMVMLRQSEVGKKLMTGLEILAHRCERQATICPPVEREHACGVAAGWRGCVGYLKTLSGKALPQQGQNTDSDPQGEEDPLKLYSP